MSALLRESEQGLVRIVIDVSPARAHRPALATGDAALDNDKATYYMWLYQLEVVMWSIEESRIVNAAPEQVWSIWTNVDGWKVWDNEIEWSRLDGEFAVGSRGVLKPKGGPKSPFVLTEVSPGKNFSDVTKLPFAELHFIHKVEPHGGGSKVTHRIELRGALSGLFAKLMGKNFQRGLPSAVERLASLAEAS
ncbi:SRPBCC family protein [Sorangium sp. So ce119]|uniref:SRPBCC family protein n=1 Tax=Sorangium sp. So ce119 TaxID=3133279 RepID=UPI003F617EE7